MKLHRIILVELTSSVPRPSFLSDKEKQIHERFLFHSKPTISEFLRQSFGGSSREQKRDESRTTKLRNAFNAVYSDARLREWRAVEILRNPKANFANHPEKYLVNKATIDLAIHYRARLAYELGFIGKNDFNKLQNREISIYDIDRKFEKQGFIWKMPTPDRAKIQEKEPPKPIEQSPSEWKDMAQKSLAPEERGKDPFGLGDASFYADRRTEKVSEGKIRGSVSKQYEPMDQEFDRKYSMQMHIEEKVLHACLYRGLNIEEAAKAIVNSRMARIELAVEKGYFDRDKLYKSYFEDKTNLGRIDAFLEKTGRISPHASSPEKLLFYEMKKEPRTIKESHKESSAHHRQETKHQTQEAKKIEAAKEEPQRYRGYDIVH